MYADPTHIRDHEVKVRLNEEEFAVVDALARYNQQQRAVFVREILLAGVEYLQKGSRTSKAA
ncbi:MULTISPECIES: hypothetical protein [Stenotrophomonas maltophilia group]|uniref:hypothetical protein n=1 Tax=Stenotrophomonas maltophilia group TaxID=995085 RepID=UPI001F5331E5|nr:hypothetical protein [Stenotrophomonas maltophilia]MCI1124790.1 hypothetical protein [Stenotrophomonas maltophilia]